MGGSMALWAVILILGTGVGLGVYMGLQYLRREPRKPVMIGMHLLAGLGGLETLTIQITGAPDGSVLTAGRYGIPALALCAIAGAGGFGSALLRRRSRQSSEAALVAHAAAGLLGLAILLIWAAQR